MSTPPAACSWAGVFPAATTQFDANLQVDLAATQAVQSALVRDGVHGLVLLGTVGENNSLSAEEKRASEDKREVNFHALECGMRGEIRRR